jgi:hypothetical protein
MAIKKIENQKPQTEPELQLKFTNGDLKALEEVKKKWKFIDFENLLRFAVAVMSKAEKNKVYIDEKGTRIGYSPADNLLKKDEDDSSSTK